MRRALNLKSRYLRVCLFFFLLWPLSHLGQAPPHTLLSSLRPQFSCQSIHSHSLYDNLDFCFSSLISFHAPHGVCAVGEGALGFLPSQAFALSLPACRNASLPHFIIPALSVVLLLKDVSRQCSFGKICHNSLVSQLMSLRAFCTLWSCDWSLYSPRVCMHH